MRALRGAAPRTPLLPRRLLLYTDDGPGADFKGSVSLQGSSCRISLSKMHSKGPQFAFETTDAHGSSTSWAAFSRARRPKHGRNMTVRSL